MEQGKSGGWTGRGIPVEDPAAICQSMQDLLRLEAEFPIKVEGTHTLPYTARVHHLDLRKRSIHLKLIRPLPHELSAGAAFDMLFSVGDQRYWAPTVFQGREGYLLYRFSLPSQMAPSDRRQHKRYLFRPREKAYVVAQDGAIPGHGISGPLVNLSLGGLAFRVDRVMRLDDHLRVTPGVGFFERGKAFPMLKIRDLPNLPLFEGRGVLANAWDRNGEIILGLQFLDLGESDLRELQVVLDIREHMQRTSSAQSGEAPRDAGPRSPAESRGPAARMSPAGTQTPDALKRLGRRSTRVVLAMAPGADRDLVRGTLAEAGYLRLETMDSLGQAVADLRADRSPSCPLLILEIAEGEEANVGAVRDLQREFSDSREIPAAVISRGEAMPDTDDPLLRPMAWPSAEDVTWQLLLDELAGLD